MVNVEDEQHRHVAGGWYGGWSRWDGENVGAGAMLRSFLAEAAGAGTVAADAHVAEWSGGGSRRHVDGSADGRGFDVKRAWPHTVAVVGFGGPGRRREFDVSKVDDVVLIVTDDSDLTCQVLYKPDGAVELTATLRTSEVYVVPATTMNTIMRRDGASRGRWLVDRAAIEPFLRRPA